MKQAKKSRSDKPVPLPPDLAGPVDVELAKAADTLPGPHALTGGCWYSPKFDGFRGVLVVADDTAHPWSRKRKDLSAAFPELIRAAHRMLPAGTVLDGEICARNGNRLDFDLLQRRLVGRRRIPELSAAAPVAFMAFDLLAANGLDLRGEPLRDRWAALENLAASWAAPLQLAPSTDNADLAKTWMKTLRPAGIEGIVAKGAGSKYLQGVRGWVKVKSRETTEVIIGAVTGPIDQPTSIVAGLQRAGGTLSIVGRSTPLTTTQATTLSAQLAAADADHP